MRREPGALFALAGVLLMYRAYRHAVLCVRRVALVPIDGPAPSHAVEQKPLCSYSIGPKPTTDQTACMRSAEVDADLGISCGCHVVITTVT